MTIRKIIVNQVSKLNTETIGSKNVPEIIHYLDTSSITRNKIENIQVLDSRVAPFPSRAQRKVKKDTIIYSTVRPEQEHFGFIENIQENLIVSTGFLTIDIIDKDIDPKFLYYSLTQRYITNHLQTIAVNNVSSYPSINPDDLGNLELEIPKEKSIQVKIAAILSALDAKIELNNRINSELEAMAKTLYDYWFVQFDFPDAHGKPYKTSGGKMVWNEELKRAIPFGWDVKSINDVIIITDGTHDSPKALDEGIYQLITSKHLLNEGLDFQKAYYISENDFIKVNKRSQVHTGDILYSMIGTVGITYMVDEEEINFAVKNVALYKTSQKVEYKNYIYMFLKSGYHLQGGKKGSIQKYISLGELRSMPLLVSDSIINLFYEKTKSIFMEISFLKKQNQELKKIRDWLLPLLMNGQVKVG